MEPETKTEAETVKERDQPNINTTHAVLWPSPLTCTHTGRSDQDHARLSPLSFAQLRGKVHTGPQTGGLPEKRSRAKVDISRLNGLSRGPVALGHNWAVFGFEREHVMPR